MKCLTETEANAWLGARGITGDPYHSAGPFEGYYLQFRAPVSHRATDAFLRSYLDLRTPWDEALVHISDWSAYQPSEMLTIDALRGIGGESRWLIDAPGHVRRRYLNWLDDDASRAPLIQQLSGRGRVTRPICTAIRAAAREYVASLTKLYRDDARKLRPLYVLNACTPMYQSPGGKLSMRAASLLPFRYGLPSHAVRLGNVVQRR